MPTGLLFQPDGQLVIADHRNHCIRRVDVAGVISTIAGTCTKHGEKGDGGPGPRRQDERSDRHHARREGRPDHRRRAERRGPEGRPARHDRHSSPVAGAIPVETAPNGTRATDLQLSHPSYVLADGAGDVYLSDFLANVVIEIGRDGRITRVAGTGVRGILRRLRQGNAQRSSTSQPDSRSTPMDASSSPTRATTGSGWWTSTGTSRPSPAAGRPASATAPTQATVGRRSQRQAQRPGRTRVRRRGQPVHLGSGQRPQSAWSTQPARSTWWRAFRPAPADVSRGHPRDPESPVRAGPASLLGVNLPARSRVREWRRRERARVEAGSIKLEGGLLAELYERYAATPAGWRTCLPAIGSSPRTSYRTPSSSSRGGSSIAAIPPVCMRTCA